jgi:outer membrane protein TolC
MMKQATAKTLSAYRILVLITLAGLVLGGCTVGPDYVRPEAEVNPSWLESSETLQEEPAEIRDWWTAFNDPVLTRLVHEAYEQNLSLRAAGLRVIQARAARGIAVGEFFPQEQAIQADYGKVKISDNNRNNPPYHGPFQTAGISFDAAWELDLWGKFRRNIYAADAALLASIAAYDDVLVTLVAEVGLTYVQIRTLERRIELAKVNVALQRQSLGITESRYRNGKVSQLDVTEARATLSNTQAGVPSLESSLRDAKLSLGVLLGRTPGELEQSLAGSSGIPTTPAELAIGVPADLLRRRPDVRAAERLGNNLFDSGSKVWSIGPALNWPILNYGRIRNNIRVQDAAFQEAAVNYQNTVLQAAAEVESSLYGFIKSREQLVFLTESAESARQSLELSTMQYTEGEIDFLRVDIAAANLTRQQDSQAAVEGLVAASLISAYKALGGGWELRVGKEFIPQATAGEMRSRTNWGNILDDPDYSNRTDLGFQRPADTADTYLAPQAKTAAGRGDRE